MPSSMAGPRWPCRSGKVRATWRSGHPIIAGSGSTRRIFASKPRSSSWMPIIRWLRRSAIIFSALGVDQLAACQHPHHIHDPGCIRARLRSGGLCRPGPRTLVVPGQVRLPTTRSTSSSSRSRSCTTAPPRASTIRSLHTQSPSTSSAASPSRPSSLANRLRSSSAIRAFPLRPSNPWPSCGHYGRRIGRSGKGSSRKWARSQ